MASTNHTPNFGLPQWLSTDKPSWLGDMNAAFLDIDTAIQANKVAVDSAASAAASAQGSAEAAKNSAEEASTSAGNAIAAAQSATSIAQGAVTTATTAGNKADAASTAAAAAQTAATTAQDTANAANTTAQAAQTAAGAAATAANQAKATAESAIDVANAVADDVANIPMPTFVLPYTNSEYMITTTSTLMAIPLYDSTSKQYYVSIQGSIRYTAAATSENPDIIFDFPQSMPLASNSPSCEVLLCDTASKDVIRVPGNISVRNNQIKISVSGSFPRQDNYVALYIAGTNGRISNSK